MRGKQAKALRKLAFKEAEHKAEGGNLEYATYTDHTIAGARAKPELYMDNGKPKVRSIQPSMRVLDHTCIKGVYRRLKKNRSREIS